MNRKKLVLVLAPIVIFIGLLIINERLHYLGTFSIRNFYYSINNSNSKSCGFLPEKYCSTGRIEVVKVNKQKWTFIGFKVPKDTPITVPFDAYLYNGNLDGKQWKGKFAILTSKEDSEFIGKIFGDIQIKQNRTHEFKKGDQIGTVSGTGITNLHGYNLLIVLIKGSDPLKSGTYEEMVERYFGGL